MTSFLPTPTRAYLSCLALVPCFALACSPATGDGTPSGGAPGTGGAAVGSGGAAAAASGGSGSGGAASGGQAATGGAIGTGGQGPSTGGAGTGGAAGGACTFQCVAECGGTVQPGTCDGAAVCCEAGPSEDPLAHLIPSAETVGLLLAQRFANQQLAYSSVSNLPGDGYKNACEWYGALGVANFTDNQTLLDSLVTKFDPLKTNFVANMTGGDKHVDRYIYGMVPLEIYLQTADESYLPLGTQVADDQQVSNQTRDAIDDMFMMTGLQAQAYRATGDDKYIDFMADIMVDYLGAQQANGLFFHNVSEAPIHWGRGNGWFAA